MYSEALTLMLIVGGAFAQTSLAVLTTESFSRSSSQSHSASSTGSSSQPTTFALVAAPSGMVASVINADACSTTFVALCTDRVECQEAYSLPLTYTKGVNDLRITFETTVLGAVADASNHCVLQGPVTAPTAGTCTVSVSASKNGRGIDTTSVFTIPTDGLSGNQVTITAGADKLPTGTLACTITPTPNSAQANIANMGLGLGAAAVAGLALL